MNETLQLIPLSEIKAGDNDRKRFKDAELEALSESMKAHGLISPVTLRRSGDQFEIVAGERRCRAAILAGWTEIPAIIKELDDDTASGIMLAENTGRVNLNPVEESKAYCKRFGSGWTVERIAKAAGVSTETVKKRMSLKSLLPMVLMLLEVGDYPIGHAELMVNLDEERQQVAHRIFLRSARGLSQQAFRDIVDDLQNEQDQGALFELEEFFLAAVSVPMSRRGKDATTGAPTNNSLPAVEVRPRDNAATILDRYISELLRSDHVAEAQAVGNVYDAMVKTNYLAVPNKATLLGG